MEGKLLTESQYKRDTLILEFYEDDPSLSLRKIAEKVEKEDIKCSKDIVKLKITDIEKTKKQIKEYEESKSVVQDNNESHKLDIAKKVIRQQNEDLKRKTYFTKDDLRALNKLLETFPSENLINNVFGRYKTEDDLTLIFNSLLLDKNLRRDFNKEEGLFRMCDCIIAKNQEIKDLKAKVQILDESIPETKILHPIDNQSIEDLEQRIEDLTAENKAKDKRIEQFDSEHAKKDVLLKQKEQIMEEITKKLDEALKQNEELTKELDKANKNYDYLVASNKERDIRFIQLNDEITVLEATIKKLKGNTHFNSSSKSKRKSKSTNVRGQQKTLF